MESTGRFLPSRMSSLVRCLLPITGSSRIVRHIGPDLLSCREISTKFLSYNFFEMLYLSNSNLFFFLLNLG